MQRISLTWIIDTFRAIDKLDEVHGAFPITQHWWTLSNADSQLAVLFDQSVYAWHLRVSRERAITLRNIIRPLHSEGGLGKPFDWQRTVAEWETMGLLQARSDFIAVFKSELSTLPAFLAGEKEGYDLNSLIDAGNLLFPKSLPLKVPEAVTDALQAGKALAFDLPTASGFHLFRVTESVLKRYWDVVSKGAARPNLETIGNYAKELKGNGFGEEKVWEALMQMAKLHRNPLIHPEVILTVEEAISIVGMARSVTGAMLSALPDAPVTTATAATVAASP